MHPTATRDNRHRAAFTTRFRPTRGTYQVYRRHRRELVVAATSPTLSERREVGYPFSSCLREHHQLGASFPLGMPLEDIDEGDGPEQGRSVHLLRMR